jgi:hypothetical protein
VSHYRIIEWNRYQHYKDRDPPWIKLHRDLLTSQTWVTLSDASRVLAIASMLVAAGTDNKIPTNPEFMKRRAYMNKVDFAPLVEAGFLELVNDVNAVADASTMLADDSNPLANDTECYSESEKRRDREEERRPASKGSRLPKDWTPTQEELEYAAAQGCADPLDTAERFKLHHWNKGTIGKDWHAGFQFWCRSEKNFKSAPKVNGFSKPDAQALPPSEPWEQRMYGWSKSNGKFWQSTWGPKPGENGCRVPASLLASH